LLRSTLDNESGAACMGKGMEYLLYCPRARAWKKEILHIAHGDMLAGQQGGKHAVLPGFMGIAG